MMQSKDDTKSPRLIRLVRHGQSQGNAENRVQGHMDAPLTELGVEQAKGLGEYLAGAISRPIEHIYASDLQRAHCTAEFVAQALGFERSIIRREDLREACFGLWEGMSKQEIEDNYPEEYISWQEDRRWRPQWCESFPNLKKRAESALKHIIEETMDQPGDILIATHGGLIHALVNLLAGEGALKSPVANCAITVIKVFSLEQWQLGDINYSPATVPPSVDMLQATSQ